MSEEDIDSQHVIDLAIEAMLHCKSLIIRGEGEGEKVAQKKKKKKIFSCREKKKKKKKKKKSQWEQNKEIIINKIQFI